MGVLYLGLWEMGGISAGLMSPALRPSPGLSGCREARTLFDVTSDLHFPTVRKMSWPVCQAASSHWATWRSMASRSPFLSPRKRAWAWQSRPPPSMSAMLRTTWVSSSHPAVSTRAFLPGTLVVSLYHVSECDARFLFSVLGAFRVRPHVPPKWHVTLAPSLLTYSSCKVRSVLETP